MSGSGLLERHAEDWRAATAHPFLDGVREGTLPPGAFAGVCEVVGCRR
jgi:thiaminase